MPPPRVGGGGTTVAEAKRSEPVRPFLDWLPPEPLPDPPADEASMLAGGGTAWAESVPFVDLPCELPSEPVLAVGGGGTGCERRSPLRVLPQLFSSWLTCDGGGATTAGAGSESLGLEERSRGGADTGGATTVVVCERGTRELARSRGVSRGAGATTVVAIEFEERILSGVAFGAGAIGDAFSVGDVRVFACATSGAGATTFAVRASCLRPAEFTSGVGGTALTAGNLGATRDDCRPSAGGGPGFGLKASRLATAESLCGRFNLGASTIVSPGLSPRATLMVCVR